MENKEIEWSAKRELAKVNYKIHTSSIKENLIVPELSKEQIYFTYAIEADLLNVALFGITASEYRPTHDFCPGRKLKLMFSIYIDKNYNLVIDDGLGKNYLSTKILNTDGQKVIK